MSASSSVRRTTCNLSRIVSAAVLGLSVLVGCATTSEPEVPPPGVQAVPAPALGEGEYWEYAVRDRYTGAPRGLLRYTVARVEAERIIVDVTRDGAPVDTHVYAGGWNGLEHPLRNTQRFRYSPSYPAYAFPLYPGKSWRRAVSSIDPATGRSYRTYVHANVVGWRRIKVPAGEFDTLEVRRRVWAGNAEWFDSQEEIVETDWYSPVARRAVVSEGTSSHIDTSRSGGGRGRPLRVQGEWLVAELVRAPAP
jgi:hypothetical protein